MAEAESGDNVGRHGNGDIATQAARAAPSRRPDTNSCCTARAARAAEGTKASLSRQPMGEGVGLISKWGRIGRPGRRKIDDHPDQGTAEKMMARLARPSRIEITNSPW